MNSYWKQNAVSFHDDYYYFLNFFLPWISKMRMVSRLELPPLPFLPGLHHLRHPPILKYEVAIHCSVPKRIVSVM